MEQRYIAVGRKRFFSNLKLYRFGSYSTFSFYVKSEISPTLSDTISFPPCVSFDRSSSLATKDFSQILNCISLAHIQLFRSTLKLENEIFPTLSETISNHLFPTLHFLRSLSLATKQFSQILNYIRLTYIRLFCSTFKIGE